MVPLPPYDMQLLVNHFLTAVGTLRPGAKNIFAPPSTKTAQFKVKNRSGRSKSRTLLFVTIVIFSNKIHLNLKRLKTVKT